MIHYTCDRCKCRINPAEQTRHVVHIEINSSVDNDPVDFDDEVDQLGELHLMLEQHHQPVDAGGDQDETSHSGNYDLCEECHRQFLRNPLGRDLLAPLGFSQN